MICGSVKLCAHGSPPQSQAQAQAQAQAVTTEEILPGFCLIIEDDTVFVNVFAEGKY